MAACDLDTASDMQEVLLQATLNNRVVYKGVSAEYCDMCGVDIPEARRLAVPGCTLCTFCQNKKERR